MGDQHAMGETSRSPKLFTALQKLLNAKRVAYLGDVHAKRLACECQNGDNSKDKLQGIHGELDLISSGGDLDDI